MTYDPTTIAREASEQIAGTFIALLNAHFGPNKPDGTPRNDAAIIDEATKIILTAAARMVAESGAREALEKAQFLLAKTSRLHDRTDHGERSYQQYKANLAALANLKRLST